MDDVSVARGNRFDLIDEGTGAKVLQERRSEARARSDMALRILGNWLNEETYKKHASFHLWVRAPDGISAEVFASMARGYGIIVTPPKAVEVTPMEVDHFRVSIGAVETETQLEEALERLRAILENPGYSMDSWSVV